MRRTRSLRASRIASLVARCGNETRGRISTSVRPSADRPAGEPSSATAGIVNAPRKNVQPSARPPARWTRATTLWPFPRSATYRTPSVATPFSAVIPSPPVSSTGTGKPSPCAAAAIGPRAIASVSPSKVLRTRFSFRLAVEGSTPAGPREVPGSAALEQPLTLVAGNDLVEEALLRARIIEVVVDDVVAQRRAGDGAVFQRRDRLAQRMREALGVRFVRIALESRRQRRVVLDPVQAGRQQRREREVGIDVAAGNPRLRSQRSAVPDDAKAAGAVVVAPGERRGRPAPRRVPLVRVDRRRDEDRELAQAGDLTGEVVLEHLRLVGERVLLVLP